MDGVMLGCDSNEADALLPDDEAVRVRLAASASTAPAVLRSLAGDQALTVRATVGLNPRAAPAADAQLAYDMDERVRALLAGKLARLLPSLSPAGKHATQTHVHATLHLLAHDAALRVRVALAEALHTVAEAPRSVVLKLAYDSATAVSNPLLRFSPLLTDADLLELLATPPHPAAAQAVASRAPLSAAMADQIVAHADVAAITVLLRNQSATIRESALDALIGQAGDHPEWHEPLVCRPALPARAIRALSLLVAGSLLELLADREDLPAGLASELRGRMAQSLERPAPHTDATVVADMYRLHETGCLNEAVLLAAASAGNCRQVAAVLSVLSGISLEKIDRAIALRSPKALVSLVARAGLTMQAGTAVQGVLGQLGPDAALRATPDGHFPLSDIEMEWQIELLS